jgi:hypothetical protein
MKDEYNNTIPEMGEFGRWKTSETSETSDFPTKKVSAERKIDRSAPALACTSLSVPSLHHAATTSTSLASHPDPPGHGDLPPLAQSQTSCLGPGLISLIHLLPAERLKNTSIWVIRTKRLSGLDRRA